MPKEVSRRMGQFGGSRKEHWGHVVAASLPVHEESTLHSHLGYRGWLASWLAGGVAVQGSCLDSRYTVKGLGYT